MEQILQLSDKLNINIYKIKAHASGSYLYGKLKQFNVFFSINDDSPTFCCIEDFSCKEVTAPTQYYYQGNEDIESWLIAQTIEFKES